MPPEQHRYAAPGGESFIYFVIYEILYFKFKSMFTGGS